jgi:hypothetical protein
MIIDSWNPNTFSVEITKVLKNNSELIVNFYAEDKRILDEYLRGVDRREWRDQTNSFHDAFQELHEQSLTPILSRTRIRCWHYTRLTDNESSEMEKTLVPSSLKHLSQRLSKLVAMNLLSREDANKIFDQSPFHSQLENRAGRICAIPIPVPVNDRGVRPLLESWGGESAYFHLVDDMLASKLKNIGLPRVVEIETELNDGFNSYSVAEIMLKAWARGLGSSVDLGNRALAIKACITSAQVIQIHKDGDGCFQEVAITYPADIESVA